MSVAVGDPPAATTRAHSGEITFAQRHGSHINWRDTQGPQLVCFLHTTFLSHLGCSLLVVDSWSVTGRWLLVAHRWLLVAVDDPSSAGAPKEAIALVVAREERWNERDIAMIEENWNCRTRAQQVAFPPLFSLFLFQRFYSAIHSSALVM